MGNWRQKFFKPDSSQEKVRFIVMRVRKWLSRKEVKKCSCVTYFCVTHQVILYFYLPSKKGAALTPSKGPDVFWLLDKFEFISSGLHSSALGIKSGNISPLVVPFLGSICGDPLLLPTNFYYLSLCKCSSKDLFSVGTWLIQWVGTQKWLQKHIPWIETLGLTHHILEEY